MWAGILCCACGSDGSSASGGAGGVGGHAGSGGTDTAGGSGSESGGAGGTGGSSGTIGSGAQGGSAGLSSGGAGGSGAGGDAGVLRPDQVDVLLVVDTSSGMNEEQVAFGAQIPRLVRGLLTGDADDDGVMESVPFSSLHIGVVTVDMGTGGPPVPSCNQPLRGDDGILRTVGNQALSGCDASYPGYQPINSASDLDVAAEQVRCVFQAGVSGCGIEQPLEAPLKALSPASSGIVFGSGDVGHGTGMNSGFLRPDSLLIVLTLTDENDCSISDPKLFDNSVYTGNLNLRCFENPGALHPTARYVSGLLALRPHPSRLFYGLIAGVPSGLTGDGYQTMLDDPGMQESVDSAQPSRLTPSCDTSMGTAFPPRRLVEVARDLEQAGAGTAVDSICQSDYSKLIDRVLAYTASL